MITSWTPALSARLSDGPEEVTVGFATNGLVQIEYVSRGGRRVRQLCTFQWLVERLVGTAGERQ